MSNFSANRIVRCVPLLRQFFAFLTAAVLFVLSQNAYSQENADKKYVDPDQPKINKLLKAIKANPTDSLKAYNYNKIAKLVNDNDTSIKYAQMSLQFCKAADKPLMANNYHLIGYALYMNDSIEAALEYYFMEADLYIKLSNKKGIANAYSSIGWCYEDLNIPDSTFKYFNKALNLHLELHDTTGVSGTYRNIGEEYLHLSLYDNAEDNYMKALSYAEMSGNKLEMAMCYRSIGEMLVKESDTTITRGIAYLKKSIQLLDSVGGYEEAMHEKYYAYTDLADAYIKLAKITGKKAYADSCYLLGKKIGNYYLENDDVISYITYRYKYVDYLVFYNRYNEALKELLRLGKYFDEKSFIIDLKTYHRRLYEVYTLLGDYKNALVHCEKYNKYKSEQLNENTINSIKNAEVERTRMIEALKRENDAKLHAAEKQRMRIVNMALFAVIGLILILVFYIARMLHVKHKAHIVVSEKNALLAEQNKLLAEQKEEIKSQNDLLTEQKEEIQAQNDLLVEQKEEILAQAETIKEQSKEIHDSINYARRIQRSLLTPSKTIGTIFPDYFVLYKPRNVVSGDYYWVGQFGDNKVSVVADCTGHGVPGGFLSVLGMANLNYIVGQEVSPDMILNHLREAIITNLRQRSDVHTALHDADHAQSSQVDLNDRSRDGMDVAVYVVNEKLMKLSYAGANNPLVLIRDSEVQVLKPDRMPVGIHECLDPFQCTTIDIQHGDCLYTFSDGFQDQFGVDTGKKFMSKRLRELLLEIHQQPMPEQKKILNIVYEEWRGPAENQTDDVVIMGVRI